MGKEIVILVGLHGSGKTYYAKNVFEKAGYMFVSMDYEYHHVIQKDAMEVDVPSNTKEFILKIKKICEDYPDRDLVIDGWFTWSKEYFLDYCENSVYTLRKETGRNVKLFYIFDGFQNIYNRYCDKLELKGIERRTMYAGMMQQKQKNLLNKCEDSCTWAE